jgi:hypothetical protein
MVRLLVPAFGKVCQGFGAALAECHGEGDHVHLLVEYPPGVPASALNPLKGVSAGGSASGTVCVPTASTYGPLPTSPHPAAALRYQSLGSICGSNTRLSASPGLNAGLAAPDSRSHMLLTSARALLRIGLEWIEI